MARLSERDILEISKFFTTPLWWEVGIHLEVPYNELRWINENDEYGNVRCAFEMLTKWSHRCIRDMRSLLLDACLKARALGVAIQLKMYFEGIPVAPPLHEIEDRVKNRPLTELEVWKLATELGRPDWAQLAIALDLPKEDVNTAERAVRAHHNHKDGAYELCMFYKQKYPLTYNVLYFAARTLGWTDVSFALEERFKKMIDEMIDR